MIRDDYTILHEKILAPTRTHVTTRGYIDYMNMLKQYNNFYSIMFEYERFITKSENCLLDTRKKESYDRGTHSYVLRFHYDYYLSNTNIGYIENFMDSFNLV